jgi:multimeric flavodoxin WrbA
MKVLLLNGSAHRNGCTFTALDEVSRALNAENIDTEIFQLGNPELRDCIGCQACRKIGKCVYEDIVNEFVEKARLADGFVFGSPVYYAHPSGRILSFLDRAFYSGSSAFAFKPAAAVVSARRSGTTASFDVLNKYFTICNMPVISSSYWNNIHGNIMEEARQDTEGLQTMRILGRNMAWILKCIESGRKMGITKPQIEEKIKTNFIR